MDEKQKAQKDWQRQSKKKQQKKSGIKIESYNMEMESK